MASRPLLPKLRHIYVRSGVRRLLPLRAKVAVRALWIRVARKVGYPISSPHLPRPHLVRHRTLMSLSRVLLACDLNPDYLEFWPSTSRAWKEIVGVDVTLIVIASAERLPPALQNDPTIVPFEPLPGVHSTFQAQCIRLLYPALLEGKGAVMISDIDLFPLRASYFHRPLELLDESFFVVYRDDRLNRREIPIAFNAAAPATWAEIFGVQTVDDVRETLGRWAAEVDYDGRRGWAGWYADQHRLYEALMAWPARDKRLWVLDDQYSRFSRLDRMDLVHEDGLEAWRARGIRRGAYSDFNCFVPFDAYREINERVLALGLEAAAGRTH